MKELKFISPFKKLCITIGNLPTAYIESMSYYEGLTFLVNYLANNVIPAVNNNSEVVKELQEQFVILKNYVDNYFENLDVQEEINNKLDQMVEDGTFEELLTLYPIKENEIGVISVFFPYGDVYRYGAKCDGETDDTTALNNAITNAILYKFPVKLHGLIYVSDTINTHGVKIIGDKQPTESGAYYPNGIGYDYPCNLNDGADITFKDYIDTIPNGTAIISDIANPILSTDYNEPFDLENFGVYGWLRNVTQEGILVNTIDAGATYCPGGHNFKNFSVFNVGSNGIHLHSLECSDIENLRVELCNGYGLYIEGVAGVDTPFDYNKIANSRFRYTRLHAIYLYNTYRQLSTFEHCNFNYIGQNDFGHVNDIYGDRDLPTSNDDIIYGICINGLNSVNPGNGRTLSLINNYGEQTNGLLNIENINTLVGLKLKDNTVVKAVGTTHSVYTRLRTTYLYRCEFDSTNSNINDYYDIGTITELTSIIPLPKQFTDCFDNINKVFKTSNEYGYQAYEKLFGNEINSKNYLISSNNYSYFNSSSGESQTVTIDTTTIIDTYFSANVSTVHGQPFTIGLLSLSNGGNTTAAPVSDLVAFTRHNNHHLVSFITNNTGATADADGIITITVPAYKIATLQLIQQVDTNASNN